MKTFPMVSRHWWAALPLLIAMALPIWQTQFRDGWLEMALGGFAWLFWSAVLTWLVLVVIAIRMHRAWWLLITAPIVLYPVIIAMGLLAACAGGDCL